MVVDFQGFFKTSTETLKAANLQKPAKQQLCLCLNVLLDYVQYLLKVSTTGKCDSLVIVSAKSQIMPINQVEHLINLLSYESCWLLTETEELKKI